MEVANETPQQATRTGLGFLTNDEINSLSSCAYKMLGVLCGFAYKANSAKVSITTAELRPMCGVSYPTFLVSIKELAKRGYVKHKKANRKAINEFIVLI